MWKLSRKSEYALMVVQRLGALGPAEQLPASALADDGDLPRDLTAKILQDLRQAGIVQSSRGVTGGYRLARPLDRLAFLDVVRPFEEHLGLADCVDGDGDCKRAEGCTLQGPVARLNHWLMGHLRGLTMAEFVGPGRGGGFAVDVPHPEFARVSSDRLGSARRNAL